MPSSTTTSTSRVTFTPSRRGAKRIGDGRSSSPVAEGQWHTKARHIGEILFARLNAAAAQDERIAEVRGRGAMVGVEFVVPGTTTPAPETTEAVLHEMYQHGAIALECGTYGSVIRFLPPLIITDAQLNEALDVFDAALAATR